MDAVKTAKSSPGLVFKTIHTDKRGSINTITREGGVEYKLADTKAGYSRGGDFHPTVQHAILLEGKATWTLKLPDGKGGYKLVTKPHELNKDFPIEPMVPHYFTSVTDSLILMWEEGGGFVQQIDPELRKHIDSANSLLRQDTK
jgi:hypothetical protein